MAFGVFQEYYSRHSEDLGGDTTSVAVIGTSISVGFKPPRPFPLYSRACNMLTSRQGILYLSSPFTFGILTRWPRLRRWFGPVGLALTAIGFLVSSFATKVWQLIATQGVICAIGSGLLFTPTTLYLDEWFVKRKGLAYGVMWAGKSITGVGMPFAAEASLRKFGPAVTLRAWSVAIVCPWTSLCVSCC